MYEDYCTQEKIYLNLVGRINWKIKVKVDFNVIVIHTIKVCVKIMSALFFLTDMPQFFNWRYQGSQSHLLMQSRSRHMQPQSGTPISNSTL